MTTSEPTRLDVPICHPRAVVSSCLVGIPCRYDGQCRTIDHYVALVASGKAIALCPETLIGLSTPRPSAEISPDGAVVTADGKDLTGLFSQGVQIALQLMDSYGSHFQDAYLQARSPTCGVGLIYDGTFTGTLTLGDGLFARALRDRGLHLHCV